MDLQLLKYQNIANERKEKFDSFELVHVSRQRNSRVDLLAKLVITKKPGNNKSVIQENISHPSIDDSEVCTNIEVKFWMTPIKAYMEENVLSKEPGEAKKIQNDVSRYSILDGRLF